MSGSVTKIDPSFLTPLARVIAGWVIPRLPRWVTPNQITVGGLVICLIGGIAFFLAGIQRSWFFIGIACLVLNWVADNLDGELARARKQTSERGFFHDIVLDQIGVILISLGIAFSSYAYDFAFLMLCQLSYQLMSFVTLLHIIMRQRFPLGRLSPAEGRLGLIILASLTYFWPNPLTVIAGHTLGWFELGLMVTLPFAILERTIGATRLYRELAPPQAPYSGGQDD